MTIEDHITKLPLGMQMRNHIRDNYNPKETWKMCRLYNKLEPPRHCRDMKCLGYHIWFCYTPPKDGEL